MEMEIVFKPSIPLLLLLHKFAAVDSQQIQMGTVSIHRVQLLLLYILALLDSSLMEMVVAFRKEPQT